MDLLIQCSSCGREFPLVVNAEDYENWSRRGVFAQVAFPYLTPDERELLISQTCGDCWEKLFPPEEDEE
jgi:hypothetical protein